jgi:hypothetical protein
MIFQYTPINHTPAELLSKMGFLPAINGWYLPRKRQAGKPNRLHALVKVNTIDIHSDYDDGGTHRSEKRDTRMRKWLEIIEAVDTNKPVEVSQKMRRNYKTLKL